MNPFEGPAEPEGQPTRRRVEPPPVRATSKLTSNRIGLALVAAGVVAWLAAGRDESFAMITLVGLAGWAALRRFGKR